LSRKKKTYWRHQERQGHLSSLWQGHWRKNCKEYLATVKSKKFNGASTLGMFIVENYLTTLYYSSWVLDTEYGFHICNCM